MNDDRRQTPSERTHEEFMALLQRPQRTIQDVTGFKQVTIGDLKGQVALEDLSIAREPGESEADYRNRCESRLEWALQLIVKQNGSTLTRELQQTVKQAKS